MSGREKRGENLEREMGCFFGMVRRRGGLDGGRLAEKVSWSSVGVVVVWECVV